MIEVTFLGTSSMVPTKDRNHSAILIKYKGNAILVDCGEGTQRQLTYAGISASKITKVLITHWHGDHVLGLPGLVQTLAAQEYPTPLEIYGPPGTKKRIQSMFSAFEYDTKGIALQVTEIKEGRFFEDDEFALETLPMLHNTQCLGYRFVEKDKRRIDVVKAKKLGLREGPIIGELQEGKTVTFSNRKIKPEEVSYIVPGRKIAVVMDTIPCKNAEILAKDADLFVCEATYDSSFEDKARAHAHMTAQQAGEIAEKAKALKLVLTHISARYTSSKILEEDAKKEFKNVVVAEDLQTVTLK